VTRMAEAEGPALDGERPPRRGEPDASGEIDALVDGVLELTGTPIDSWAVAATLESRGLRDVDARVRYGHRDMFGLAEVVFARARARLEREPPVAAGPEDEVLSTGRRARRAVGWYLIGAVFILPLALQAVSLVLFGVSLWAFLAFSYAQATAVACAILASFLVTAGFEQAIGRLGPLFVERGQPALARRASLGAVWTGMLFAATAGLAAWALNRLGGFFPEAMLRVSLAYYGLLCALALSSAVLYMLERWAGIVASTVAGLVVVELVLRFTSLGIYAAHWAGLAVAVACAYGWAFAVLHKRVRRAAPETTAARLPRASITLTTLLPNVAYGVLYALLIFSDRVLAWSVRPNPEGIPLWFDTPYEIGLDLALIVTIPTLALLHYSVKRLSKVVIPLQNRFSALEVGTHNAHLVRFHVRQLALLGAFTLAVVSAFWAFVEVLALFDALASARAYVGATVAWDVFVWGLIGYVLLSVGLLNAVFLFALALPGRVLTGLGPAVLLCIVLEFALSRGGDYWWSVIGMAGGCAVFAGLTTLTTVRVLRRGDYHYYAAY